MNEITSQINNITSQITSIVNNNSNNMQTDFDSQSGKFSQNEILKYINQMNLFQIKQYPTQNTNIISFFEGKNDIYNITVDKIFQKNNKNQIQVFHQGSQFLNVF
ncbi:hypothetical protein ABPG72_018170 [Tetrahymena utriculariae]